MTLPIQNAQSLAASFRTTRISNLIAQSKAQQVLREVQENIANFPDFDSDLDNRTTFVAYGLLAAGCSLVESNETLEGQAELLKAADLLESVHRTESSKSQVSSTHCLVGAMAFYACGQYSRAFVLIRQTEAATPTALIVSSFLKKNYTQLLNSISSVLLREPQSFLDQRLFDDWALTVCIARSVSSVFEFLLSGEKILLDNADDILKDAMVISKEASHPSFWWTARLLRLMFRDLKDSSLWSVLPPFFGPDAVGQVDRYIQLMALSLPPVVELWQSQTAALSLALDPTNRGGVINLRTSAGKTRVAELAMLQTLSMDPEAKILYLAPFRSLAFELERTFSKTLSPLGYSVSHLYGGTRFSNLDREQFSESQITIATPEKAKAMMRASFDMFSSIKLIVVDEGHLLGGNERNVRNELFLEHLRLLARKYKTRILLLSAVLPNASDLAMWIGGSEIALVKSDWKPSAERFGTLRWKTSGASIEWSGAERCFNPHFIEFKQVPHITPTGKVKSRQFPKTKTECVAAAAVRLSELGPVLVFAGQAQWVDSMARAVLLALGENPPRHKWTKTEWGIFEAVCLEELGPNSFELIAARLGVICHSNKLPSQVRIAVEKLMAKRSPLIVIATTTLAQGVNIGVASVIVATTSIGRSSRISKRDFWNICGRAGRAFVDGEGKVLFAIDATKPSRKVRQAEAEAKNYFEIAKLDEVESGLLQLINILMRIATSAEVSFETLLELVSNNHFDPLGEQKTNAVEFLDLIDDQLLALHVAYNGDSSVSNVDWVDDAFRQSLAAIQERARVDDEDESTRKVIAFLRARALGVLQKVPSIEARHVIVSSGLPLSVGTRVFEQRDFFHQVVDRYIAAGFNQASLESLVLEFETWTRSNAVNIVEDIADSLTLDAIRPQWLAGDALHSICLVSGEGAANVCNKFYGYQLSWIIHSVSQNFDAISEEEQLNAVSLAGLLVELGLPTEASAKVFMAGVRSRVSAVELGKFITNPKASVNSIRASLLDASTIELLEQHVSSSTFEWLRLLGNEHNFKQKIPPACDDFSLDTPNDVSLLHVRQFDDTSSVFLCSTDGRFKFAVSSSLRMPFRKYANDLRFAFLREDDYWTLVCRDPRVLS